jgi:DUF971 family protein
VNREDGSSPGPLEVTGHRVEPDGSLWLDWNDGHQSVIRPERLRRGCPCAQCREEREAIAIEGAARKARGETAGGTEVPEPAPFLPGSTKLISLSPVGRYALAPSWGDGHATGIYSWDILRSLCDCFACRIERGEA